MRPTQSCLATVVFSFLPLTLLGCSSASTASAPPTPSIVAPSNLSYPAPSLSITVGQSLAPDTPTVSGSSATFAVSPALPTGLSIAATTGIISGSPTAIAALAAYTVSATNSAGTTSATLQLAVQPAAPASLSYPQPTLAAVAGTAISQDVPTFIGMGTFTVLPALPAGLSLNATSGIISGTPSTYGTKTSYTVTLANVTGSITAALSISVLSSSKILLELGQVGQIQSLQLTTSRVLEQDATTAIGSVSPLHWALYDYTSTTKLASGQQTQGSVALAGDVLIVDGSTASAQALTIRSAVDGSLLATVPSYGSWWKLASDGSYLVTGSATALSVYSPQGAVLSSRPGNYSTASAYAAPGSVQIAAGPAGANVIETVTTANGGSTLTPNFAGTFNAWFTDGSHFLTTVGNVVYLYSNAAAQQGILNFTGTHLGGVGNYFYGDNGTSLQVYSIGSSTPVSSTPETGFIASGSYLAVLAPKQVTVIDLSGSNPAVHTLPSSFSSQVAFAETSAAQSVVGLGGGAIVDGATLSGTSRFFGVGSPDGLAASPVRATLNTRANQILLFDSTTLAAQPALSYQTATTTSQTPISLSLDGSVLALPTGAPLIHLGVKVNVLSLPSGTLLNTFDDCVTFTVSNSGALFGAYIGAQYQVLPILGGTPQLVAAGPSYLAVGQQTTRISPTTLWLLSPVEIPATPQASIKVGI